MNAAVARWYNDRRLANRTGGRAVSDSATITRPDTREEQDTKLLPPYNVILANDDYHSVEFVVQVLFKVFAYEQERCWQLMLQAHNSGRSVIWTGAKEVAELKQEQMTTFHEKRGERDLGPLGVTIEPAPG